MAYVIKINNSIINTNNKNNYTFWDYSFLAWLQKFLLVLHHNKKSGVCVCVWKGCSS